MRKIRQTEVHEGARADDQAADGKGLLLPRKGAVVPVRLRARGHCLDASQHESVGLGSSPFFPALASRRVAARLGPVKALARMSPSIPRTSELRYNVGCSMNAKPQLFGTDGVRGVAGQHPLDRDTVWKLGSALGAFLARRTEGPIRVVIGEDTRESSPWISRALAAGLRSRGAEVVYAGVVTTPAMAFLTRHHGFSAGAMVSASHNPYSDNGIKILSPAGTKLSEADELEIEHLLAGLAAASGTDDEPLQPLPDLLDDYLDFLSSFIPAERLAHYRLVVDCAHGASSWVAPRLLQRLGLKAHILHAEPNGRNINLGCGAVHPEAMAAETRRTGADLGVAFDGDADRAIFATREGRVADGDYVLFAAAPFMEQHGKLRGKAVVGTLMTNLGLEIALARQGIGLRRTAVGDKYVLEEMLRSGINLGGEPSGHIIFADLSLAGDGLLTLLQVLSLMAETGHSFEHLAADYHPFPQLIRNVCVREKKPLESVPEIAAAIEAARREFGDRGRIVVRYSGTEPLARVMVEGESREAVERHAGRIAAAIHTALGAG